LLVITPSRSQIILQRFYKETDGLFVEAKRSTVASITSMPTWAFVLLVILGYNEFMIILRNPFLTMILFFVTAGIY
jgi:hypothetical protein